MSLVDFSSAVASVLRPPLVPTAAYLPFRGLTPPIIVVGAHRSGTSLVAAMLQTLGVSMGCPELNSQLAQAPLETLRNGGYCEAQAFYLANELLLHRAGARWDQADRFLLKMTDSRFLESSLGCLRAAAWTFVSGAVRAQVEPRQRWGWKDPRNSLTLPLWLNLLPEARVLHVRRGLESVAASLHSRALQAAAGQEPAALHPSARLPLGFRALWHLQQPQPLFKEPVAQPESDPCLDLRHCRSLSHLYASRARDAACQARAQYAIDYEWILQKPLAAAQFLSGAAGLSSGPDEWARAAALVIPRNAAS